MLNVNLTIHYDNDLSFIYFEDFKQEANALFLGNRRTDYLVIFENSEIQRSAYFKKSRLAKMDKSELYDLALKMDLVSYSKSEYKKADLIEFLLEISNEEYYSKHYEIEYYSDLDYDFSISEYSQGDYLKVKKVGSDKFKNEFYSKEYLENIFFDCPIYGRLTISEIDPNADFLHLAKETEIFELYLEEFLSDDYNYSKDELLLNFKEYNFNKYYNLLEFENKYNLIFKDFIFNYLSKNLPEYLEHR